MHANRRASIGDERLSAADDRERYTNHIELRSTYGDVRAEQISLTRTDVRLEELAKVRSWILIYKNRLIMTQQELAMYSQYIEPERLKYIEHQQQLFERAKPTLLAQYLNEYVAFEDGQVLDYDRDRQCLTERIYAKYGYRDLLIRKVTLQERVYSVGGFQVMQQPED